MSLLDNLNPEQQQAVTLPQESALVLAGAGSGKTRVLTTRIAWLLQEQRVPARAVLATTFANKAAREMNERLHSLSIKPRHSDFFVGTFHSLSHRFLRRHAGDAGLISTFQIIDNDDQKRLVKRLMRENDIDEKSYPPRSFTSFINRHKEQGLRASDVELSSNIPKADFRRLAHIYEVYEAYCQREGLVDFAELLLRTYELLIANQELRQHYQARFRHILVDEFQDTSGLQYRWLQLLAGIAMPHPEMPPAAVFVVGDDDQSIYAFRGAEVSNLRDFESDFRVKHVIKLEQNYRSTGNILQAANGLIRNNTERLGKNLRTDAGQGAPIEVATLPDEDMEARWVVSKIQELVEGGVARSEIAILYRSNAQSRVLEQKLTANGIIHRVYGGQRFFERAEIKDALAYLRLAVNLNDNISFSRVVNFPPRGIGDRSLEQLTKMLATANSGSNINPDENQQETQDTTLLIGMDSTAPTSLYHAAKSVSGRLHKVMEGFLHICDELVIARQDYEKATQETQQNMLIQDEHSAPVKSPLMHFLAEVIRISGLEDYYEKEPDGGDRLDNLRELQTMAAGFDLDDAMMEQLEDDADNLASATTPDDTPLDPLQLFLANTVLNSEAQSEDADPPDAVQLMTVHAAKGLEFPYVFITGLEEGLFPSERAGDEEDQKEEKKEEERRLMYVAITRARIRLWLSYAKARRLYKERRPTVPSSFIREIPQETLQRLHPITSPTRYDDDDSYDRSSYSPRFNRRPSSDDDFSSPAPRSKTYKSEELHSSIASTGSQSVVATSKTSSEATRWRIGQSVRHTRFGEGVVLRLEGSGSDARIKINFSKHGEKYLVLAQSPLEAVG